MMQPLDQVEVAAVKYAKDVHEYYGYEDDPWKLAHLLGLDIRRGEHDALIGNTITLGPLTYSSRKRSAEVIRHEIAHHLLALGGVEGQVFLHRNSHAGGVPTLEKLAFHINLVLLIPDPVYKAAVAKYGHLPPVVLEMCDQTGASLRDGLRRWVYAEVGAKRAAYVMRRKLVVDAASANYWLPFWLHDELESRPGIPLVLPPEYGEYGRDCWLGTLAG